MKWLREMFFGPTPSPSRGEETPELDDGMGDIVDKYYDERDRLFGEYVPKGPAFKIVQVPDGHYVIQRRIVKKARLPREFQVYTHNWIRKTPKGRLFDKRHEKENFADPKPHEYYETVKNLDAPVVEKSAGILHTYMYNSHWSARDDKDLMFFFFDDAEAYLKRMAAKPEEMEVWYDFPPLKRRKKAIREERNEG